MIALTEVGVLTGSAEVGVLAGMVALAEVGVLVVAALAGPDVLAEWNESTALTGLVLAVF